MECPLTPESLVPAVIFISVFSLVNLNTCRLCDAVTSGKGLDCVSFLLRLRPASTIGFNPAVSWCDVLVLVRPLVAVEF